MKNQKLYKIKKLKIYIENIINFLLNLVIKEKFNKSKYNFSINEVWYSPWETDKEFNELYLKIFKYTLISKQKLYCLYNISKQISKINGSFLEIGTLQGGSGALLASNLKKKELILWDNWGGDVEDSINNNVNKKNNYFVDKIYADKDDFLLTKNLVEKFTNQNKTKLVFKNNLFPDNKIISSINKNISLVHFDLYNKDAFINGIELIWPKIIDGGVFIISAYGSISLDPLTDAVNHYYKKNKKNCIFFQTFSGLAILFKSRK